jgi:hypothetical protein
VGPIDVRSFSGSIVVTQPIYCQKCSRVTTIKVSNGELVDVKPEPADESDVDQYIDVPDHIKDSLKEAYVCKNSKVGRAGACVVRLILDDLLHTVDCHQERPYAKVVHLEGKCHNDLAFSQQHASLCRRVDIFKTIASLAGYYAHGQMKIVNVSPGEFELYLKAVEAAVKDRWPTRQ